MLATSRSAAAARAAVAAAAALGVTGVEPAILADGSNVIVHLAPSPLVAKVPGSSTAVRPGIDGWLGRELDLACFLTAAGAPVMTPSAEVPAQVHHAEGHAMSFWTYLKPSDAWPPDEATIGSMLRDLHGVLRSYPAALLPSLPDGPLADIPAFLARRQTSPASQALVSDPDAARPGRGLQPADRGARGRHRERSGAGAARRRRRRKPDGDGGRVGLA